MYNNCVCATIRVLNESPRFTVIDVKMWCFYRDLKLFLAQLKDGNLSLHGEEGWAEKLEQMYGNCSRSLNKIIWKTKMYLKFERAKKTNKDDSFTSLHPPPRPPFVLQKVMLQLHIYKFIRYSTYHYRITDTFGSQWVIGMFSADPKLARIARKDH